MAFRAAGAAWSFAASGTTLNLAAPAGVVSGDVLFACFSIDQGSSTVSTVPSGWTVVSAASGMIAADGQSYWVYKKTAGGSEPSTYSFAVSTGYNGGWAVIVAFSGRDASSLVVGVDISNSANSSPISSTAPTVTAPASADLLAFYTLDQLSDDAWISTAPSGMTQRATGTGGDTGYCSISVCTQDAVSAGATGAKTALFVNALGGTAGWGAVLISIPAAAGGGTSIAPGIGALSLATFAPTIGQPHGVAPGVTALTLASFAPAVAQPIAVSPGVGAISLATFAPSVGQPHGVVPTVATLTLAGYAPTVAQAGTGTNVLPGAGALVLTTFAPATGQTANQSLAPAAIALTLSGFAPTVLQPQGVAPGVVALSLTTFAPLVAQPQGISPASAVLVLQGYAPSVVVGAPSQNILPDAGVLILQGYAPSVSQAAPNGPAGKGSQGRKIAIQRRDGRVELFESEEEAEQWLEDQAPKLEKAVARLARRVVRQAMQPAPTPILFEAPVLLSGTEEIRAIVNMRAGLLQQKLDEEIAKQIAQQDDEDMAAAMLFMMS